MTKWLVLAALIVAVWFGYRWLERTQKIRAQARREAPRPQPEPRRVAAEDMSKCRVCGVYISPDSAPCGRPDCPLRPA